jgi:phosphonate ABC transporter permease subunit PhnE
MPERPVLRSVGLIFGIVLAVIVYAFGFQVTDVSFETTRSEQRLTQLTRILRALVHPNILEYEQTEVTTEAPIYLPCPADGVPAYEPDTSGPYLILTPACGGPKEIIQVEGRNFLPETNGPINFIPPSGATLNISRFETDVSGTFTAEVELPNRQPVEQAQTLRVITRQNIGSPFFSRMAKITFDKIVETVFLALLATTLGTILAVPLSFIAAKNLMDEVRSPLLSLSLALLGWPIGVWIGSQGAGLVNQLTDSLSANVAPMLGGLVLSPIVIWGTARYAFRKGEALPASGISRIGRGVAIGIAGAAGILLLYLAANLALVVGDALVEPLGILGFLGSFIFQLGDSLFIVTPLFAALMAGGALGGLGGRIGQRASDDMPSGIVKTLGFLFAALAGAILFAIIGAVVNWFYQIDDPTKTLWIPGGIGAALGLLLAARSKPRQSLPIGSAMYFITRTALNGTRSVEPLIMVIVFVVWVGIGPFAGALALGLHTVAALAKLFSEQVESILPGPLEAVQATGANRLQTIVYAVVPQIVPPYISFLMYRWDINVRMSTIIGFAGGGGIGFLLQQNINLLKYRDASVQMLAIAVVVATMDYVSSTMRQRFV